MVSRIVNDGEARGGTEGIEGQGCLKTCVNLGVKCRSLTCQSYLLLQPQGM